MKCVICSLPCEKTEDAAYTFQVDMAPVHLLCRDNTIWHKGDRVRVNWWAPGMADGIVQRAERINWAIMKEVGREKETIQEVVTVQFDNGLIVIYNPTSLEKVPAG